MPSFGLPKILEQTINNILEEYKLASYKIAGNGPRTTIVLRFDANMADASVSPIHPKVGIVGSPQDRIEETEKDYRNR